MAKANYNIHVLTYCTFLLTKLQTFSSKVIAFY